jgi:hypothetical protein
MTYRKRLWLARRFPLWTHRWFLSREEILAWNEQAYNDWRELAGLPFTKH